MHNLLLSLFKRRGIENIKELSPEEKKTFDNWDKILSKEELTLKDIKNFCKAQVSIIEGKWKDMATTNAKKAEMIPYHTVYKAILSAIDAPKVAREALEKQLNELIK